MSYENNFAFIGLYIVKEEYRKQGYGIQLWNNAITKLGDVNIGLDGVVEQQENYKKSGFKLAYRNIRYEILANPTKESFSDVVPITDIDFDELLKYDSKLFVRLDKIF